jgi:hypothetical protein
MREFLARLGPNDRVLLIGDIRQHQEVEAGRLFEQLQEAGMRTAKFDEIIRQADDKNHVWSYDLLSPRTHDNRSVRLLIRANRAGVRAGHLKKPLLFRYFRLET